MDGALHSMSPAGPQERQQRRTGQGRNRNSGMQAPVCNCMFVCKGKLRACACANLPLSVSLIHVQRQLSARSPGANASSG